MIYQELSRWIAQSESWQAFVDYKIPDDEQARYNFLHRPDDFYISLLSQIQETLEAFYENESEENKKDLLAVAKGLEIYSLIGKRESFSGVNYNRNMLYVASFYYLADFSATSFLLLKLFNEEMFKTDIERFIYYFLSRNYRRKEAQENPYFNNILIYLREGDIDKITELQNTFQNILQTDNQIESHLFVLAYIARSILKKFSSNNLWYDLREYGSEIEWKPFVRFNIGKIPQIWSFFPSQQAAVRRGLLTFERAFSLQTPTSSGKTAIAELVIYNEMLRRPHAKILYLAPFRALASELKNNLGRSLSSRLGIKVKTIYGGNIITNLDRLSIGLSNVLISTPEKFMAIEISLRGILDEFQTVICDEGHLIDNATRGISYELLLSRLKRNTNVTRRFVFLSAIIPNIEVINTWLGGTDKDIAKSNYRPTEIELAFLREVGNRQFNLEVNPQEDFPRKYILNHFLSQTDFQNGKMTYSPTTFKSKTVSAALKSLNSGAVAVFAPTKDYIQGVAGIAAEVIRQQGTNLPKPINFTDEFTIRNLVTYFQYIFGQEFLLVQAVERGFLFHHGDLPQFIRELIENNIRNEKVKFLICTNTLSEGVNLPIKTLIISKARRYESRQNPDVPLALRDIKNLIGRAGRAGKETKGTIIVVNPKDQSILLDVIANRNLEDVKGFLFYVVQIIERYITRQGTNLNNELLDQLKESDYIDNSIIQLLAEDISIEQLDQAVSTLVENTLTFYQSDDNLKLKLRQLFNLRSERVRTVIENGNINVIRYSGIPLRAFNQVEELVDFDQDFLSEIKDPLDPNWIKYLFDILFGMKDFKESVPNNYSREILISALSKWISGGWYHDIAQTLNGSVEDALSFVRFLEYSLQNSSSSIIKYIELKRVEVDKAISLTVQQWSNYVIYGVKNRLELDLTEINVPDRILVHSISNWIELNPYNYLDLTELKSYVIENNDAIFLHISDKIPRISIDLFRDFISNR